MVLVQLDQRRQKVFFVEQSLVDLREDVRRQCEIQHRNKGLLYSWLTFNQCAAINRGRNPLKNSREQVRLQPTNVAQCHCRAGLEILIECRSLLLLLSVLLQRSQENGEKMVNGLE